jgi:hypothetical protein
MISNVFKSYSTQEFYDLHVSKIRASKLRPHVEEERLRIFNDVSFKKLIENLNDSQGHAVDYYFVPLYYLMDNQKYTELNIADSVLKEHHVYAIFDNLLKSGAWCVFLNAEHATDFVFDIKMGIVDNEVGHGM